MQPRALSASEWKASAWFRADGSATARRVFRDGVSSGAYLRRTGEGGILILQAAHQPD